MKHKIILLLCALFLCVATAFSQVFLMEEDLGERELGSEDEFNLQLPDQGDSNDHTGYVPIGEGFILLTSMCAAYGASKMFKNRKSK